jgi:ABC-2 type transport system permease protein
MQADASSQRHARRAGSRAALRAEASAMRDALAAEWVKLRTLPGSPWLLLAVVVTTVAVSAAASAATRCPAGVPCTADPARVCLSGIYLGQAVVAILGVLIVSGEYSTGMISVTLAALPRRTTVLTAKAVIVTGLTLAAGTVAVGGSLLAGAMILPGHGFTSAGGFPDLSLAGGTVLRAAAGSVLYLGLIGLLAVGAAAAFREAAAAIGTVLGLLYLFPVIAALAASRIWQRHLQQVGPMTAGLEIQATRNLHSLVISPWAGLGVLAAWAAGALIAGGLLLRLRDA